MAKIYTFHCLICGGKFNVKRNDAKTCSKICRVTLSQMQNHGAYEEADELNDKEATIVDEKIKQVHDGGVPKDGDLQVGFVKIKKENREK